MEPTIKQLKYLKALKEEKSFSEAAQKCFVTQSTLSAGIKELEQILGHPLVDRSNRSNRLTSLGEETAQTAALILSQLETLAEKATHEEKPFYGPIRIGVIPTIAPYMIPDVIPLLQKHYPDLTPYLYEDMSHILVKKLNDGDLDIAIIALPYKTQNLIQEPLFEETFTALCPKSMKVKPPLNLKTIDPDQVLLLADGHCLRIHVQDALGKKKTSPNQENAPKRNLNATSLATLIQMVNHGYGMTLLPAMALHHSQLPNTIKQIEIADPKPTRTIGLCWHPAHPKNHEYKKIMKMLKSSLHSH